MGSVKNLGEYNFFQENFHKIAKNGRQRTASGNYLIINHQIL